MDPQQRIFLECAWEALEDAGYDSERLTVPVGVYAGASMNSYLLTNLLANPEALATAGAYQTMIGNDKDFLATRVVIQAEPAGPGITVQTACSTSLVASTWPARACSPSSATWRSRAACRSSFRSGPAISTRKE